MCAMNTTSGPRFWALVPCAGSGARAGSPLPKQYQELAGQSMVRHTLAALSAVAVLHQILVVLAPDDRLLQPGAGDAWRVAHCGGATRALSVANGLAHLRQLGAAQDDWVLVHDAARCLVTPEQVARLVQACAQDEVGGLLALPLADTLKQAQGERVQATLSRSDKWLAQTPQMFRLELLERALRAAGEQVTDESSAVEALGLSPRLVPGSAQNFKVTYPEDFALARAVLEARMQG